MRKTLAGLCVLLDFCARNDGGTCGDDGWRLDDFQSHYNEYRVHDSLDLATPYEYYSEHKRRQPDLSHRIELRHIHINVPDTDNQILIT